jgi:D-galacturonate reductase
MVSVGVIGGGMIVHDQILPSLYQLQRHGIVDRIQICARNESTLAVLKANAKINTAFPAATFEAKPGHYSQVLEQLPPRSIVIVALPDQIHFEVTMDVLRAGHHVICVKPLVLKTEDSLTIEHEAATRELLVAVEYHKRFDDRSLMARKRYRDGLFGDFKLGNAWLHEKWDYRHSNFQNWFTCENSDAFTYIGCHYVDLVHFVTGSTPPPSASTASKTHSPTATLDTSGPTPASSGKTALASMCRTLSAIRKTALDRTPKAL